MDLPFSLGSAVDVPETERLGDNGVAIGGGGPCPRRLIVDAGGVSDTGEEVKYPTDIFFLIFEKSSVGVGGRCFEDGDAREALEGDRTTFALSERCLPDFVRCLEAAAAEPDGEPRRALLELCLRNSALSRSLLFECDDKGSLNVKRRGEGGADPEMSSTGGARGSECPRCSSASVLYDVYELYDDL